MPNSVGSISRSIPTRWAMAPPERARQALMPRSTLTPLFCSTRHQMPRLQHLDVAETRLLEPAARGRCCLRLVVSRCEHVEGIEQSPLEQLRLGQRVDAVVVGDWHRALEQF